MINCVVCGNNYYISSISSISTITTTSCRRRSRLGRFKSRAFLNKPPLPLFPKQDTDTSSVVLDNSLRLLEWDKLCDVVSSFASTSFGKQATKAQLWYLNQTYEESMRLLGETNADVKMHKYGGCVMDFNGIDVVLHVREHHLDRISIQDIETTVNSRSTVPYSRAEIMFLLEKLGDDKIMIHEDTVYIL
ncbi:unnamed protein product [Camellia sinensis]